MLPCAPGVSRVIWICVGGPHYDGRKLQEARDLITKARNGYGGLSHGNEQFLTKQLVQIHLMQAEKDYDTAKLYERIGHPGSAYFCYEIVKRRYPGTPFIFVSNTKPVLR